MDTDCERILGALGIPELTPIALSQLEAWDPELAWR